VVDRKKRFFSVTKEVPIYSFKINYAKELYLSASFGLQVER
jgi:hypothetical protein